MHGACKGASSLESRSIMGKKYEAYEKAVSAENTKRDNLYNNSTEQNLREAQQARRDADLLFDEFLSDPEG